MTTQMDDIRKAIATSVQAVPGISKAEAYTPDGVAVTPLFYLKRPDIEYHATFGADNHDAMLEGILLLDRNDIEASQAKLDQMLEQTGVESVVEAIEQAILGSSSCKGHVVRAREIGGRQFGQDIYVGAVLEVLILR